MNVTVTAGIGMDCCQSRSTTTRLRWV